MHFSYLPDFPPEGTTMFKTIAIRLAIWSLPAFVIGLLGYWGFLTLTKRQVGKLDESKKVLSVGDKKYSLVP